jgi:hypothetical protein
MSPATASAASASVSATAGNASASAYAEAGVTVTATSTSTGTSMQRRTERVPTNRIEQERRAGAPEAPTADVPNVEPSPATAATDMPAIIAQAIERADTDTVVTAVEDEIARLRTLLFVALGLLTLNSILLVSLLFLAARPSRVNAPQRF